MKPRSYASDEKVSLNSKYIKTKKSCKLEAKFFRPFWVLHPVGKQAYKLKLPTRWKIHDVFHVLLLEQDTTRKGQEFSVPEFEPGNNKEYKMEAIRDSAVYAKEVDGYLLGLYYLVAWKGYPKEKTTWELFSTVIHLRKMVNTFHKDHPEKLTIPSAPLDSTSPMAKLIIQLPTKRKWGRLKRCTTKRAKWGDKEESESVWFLVESEAGRRPEICLPGVGSVKEPTVTVWPR